MVAFLEWMTHWEISAKLETILVGGITFIYSLNIKLYYYSSPYYGNYILMDQDSKTGQ